VSGVSVRCSRPKPRRLILVVGFAVLIASCGPQQPEEAATNPSKLKVTDKYSGLCEFSIASNTLNPETLEIYESSLSDGRFYYSAWRDANRTRVGVPTIKEAMDQTRDLIEQSKRGVQFSQFQADEAKRVADIVKETDDNTTRMFEKINIPSTEFISVRIKYNNAAGAHITRNSMCALVTDSCRCLPDQEI
jgi:hypothetical protein